MVLNGLEMGSNAKKVSIAVSIMITGFTYLFFIGFRTIRQLARLNDVLITQCNSGVESSWKILSTGASDRLGHLWRVFQLLKLA